MTINFNQDTETLARWANTLNRWTWPADMPDKDIFHVLPVSRGKSSGNQPSQHEAIILALIEIKQRIGDKEMLRYHHIHNLKKSNEDFESWWVDKGKALLDTKVALTIDFDADGIPIAEARVITEAK